MQLQALFLELKIAVNNWFINLCPTINKLIIISFFIYFFPDFEGQVDHCGRWMFLEIKKIIGT